MFVVLSYYNLIHTGVIRSGRFWRDEITKRLLILIRKLLPLRRENPRHAEEGRSGIASCLAHITWSRWFPEILPRQRSDPLCKSGPKFSLCNLYRRKVIKITSSVLRFARWKKTKEHRNQFLSVTSLIVSLSLSLSLSLQIFVIDRYGEHFLPTYFIAQILARSCIDSNIR